jgi:hypothetical protein
MHYFHYVDDESGLPEGEKLFIEDTREIIIEMATPAKEVMKSEKIESYVADKTTPGTVTNGFSCFIKKPCRPVYQWQFYQSRQPVHIRFDP